MVFSAHLLVVPEIIQTVCIDIMLSVTIFVNGSNGLITYRNVENNLLHTSEVYCNIIYIMIRVMKLQFLQLSQFLPPS